MIMHTRNEDGLRILQVMGSLGELNSEVLRLHVLYPHNDVLLDALGVSREDLAAFLGERLPEPDGACDPIADDGRP